MKNLTKERYNQIYVLQTTPGTRVRLNDATINLVRE